MITSASFAASATLKTFNPAPTAFCFDLVVRAGRNPTTTARRSP